jgi:DNA-binding MarR family transcriptional regulator
MEFIDLVLKVREILFDFSLQAREANSEPDMPDLTLKQFYYLDIINRMKLITSSELSEKLKVSKPAVTAIVTKLLDLGYLNKTQCNEDRRFFYISLSEKGNALIETNNKTAKEWAHHIESVLSEDERKKYSEMLEKVIASYTLKKT